MCLSRHHSAVSHVNNRSYHVVSRRLGTTCGHATWRVDGFVPRTVMLHKSVCTSTWLKMSAVNVFGVDWRYISNVTVFYCQHAFHEDCLPTHNMVSALLSTFSSLVKCILGVVLQQLHVWHHINWVCDVNLVMQLHHAKVKLVMQRRR